jgi:L-threonylcarbamoyladenylate synthase
MQHSTRVLPGTQTILQEAQLLIRSGEVVAVPTETVYGLAADARNPAAVKKIYEAKDRPEFDPLIVHVSEQHLKSPAGLIPSLVLEGVLAPQVAAWKHRDALEKLMIRFWPGPLSIVLPRGQKIPDIVTNKMATVAIRCPANPVFQSLLKLSGAPLAAPSANRFGRISPTRAEHVFQELNGRIPLILDGGPCAVGVESTILKFEDEPLRLTLLRPGKVSVEDITRITGAPVTVIPSTSRPEIVAPGMLDEHYAPVKPLLLCPRPFQKMVASMVVIPDALKNKKMGILSMGPLPESFWTGHRPEKVIELSSKQDPLEMSQRLFLSMRELDQDPHVDWILADVPAAASGLSDAIRDRLKRASQNKPRLE